MEVRIKSSQANRKFSTLSKLPNPFNPQTTIAYDLAANSQVALKIYDLLGEEVKTLVDDFQFWGKSRLPGTVETILVRK